MRTRVFQVSRRTINGDIFKYEISDVVVDYVEMSDTVTNTNERRRLHDPSALNYLCGVNEGRVFARIHATHTITRD